MSALSPEARDGLLRLRAEVEKAKGAGRRRRSHVGIRRGDSTSIKIYGRLIAIPVIGPVIRGTFQLARSVLRRVRS